MPCCSSTAQSRDSKRVEQWEELQLDWADQHDWVTYMEQEWVHHKECWARAWRQHAHYGIDTNNFVESWHSNLKKNYIGWMRKQRVDFMICLLTQDIEPDYMRAHIRIGLGFKGRAMCKAERENRRKADELNSEDAVERVRELNEEQIQVESFSQEGVVYTIRVDDGGICACDCHAFTHSCLPCKHMFLAQRVTTNNISLDQAILPSRNALQPVDQNNQREDKDSTRNWTVRTS
ncbi:hypothetical protein K439DRAFT_1660372 [Ramaria rubella]|nr:hypothetical protein K439DRAFT_1660372 [Ramaria rubella]